MIARIIIEPLEPLMFRGPGEFDPSARGIATSAQSTGWPSPSTLTGALISELISMSTSFQQSQAQSWDDTIERGLALLGKVGIEWIRGPYISSSHPGLVYVPLILEGRRICLVDLNPLIDAFSRFLKREVSYDTFIRMIEASARREPILVYSQRTGTALRTRDEGVKGVREGFLYTESLVAVRRGFFAVEAQASPSIQNLRDRALKLGGEGRIARVKIDEDMQLVNGLKAFKEGYAVLLSPFLMLETPDIEVSEERGMVVTYKGMDIEVPMGRVDVKGLGFSVNERRRKPMLPAIFEGSIVRVKSCQNVLQLGLYGCLKNPSNEESLLAKIGFGSFYPLPGG